MTATILERAQAAVKAGQWSEAASLYETAYQATQTLAINVKLVTALKQVKKYTLACTYAAEYETAYVQTTARFKLYLTILLASHQFIKARLMTMAASQLPKETTAKAWSQIAAAEQIAEHDLQQTLTTTMRQFYHLSDQPVAVQTERLAAAQHLTYDKYVTAAKFLLLDPFLHQLSRVEVLYTLRGLGVNTPVDFVWFDQTTRQVIPAQLPIIDTDPVSDALQANLQQVSQSDVSLAQSLQAELSLQLMYLYPYPAEVITDAKVWLTILIATQQGRVPQHLTVMGQQMYENQTKIRKFNENLV